MQIRFIDERSKSSDVSVAKVDDKPLVYNGLYTVHDALGRILLTYAGIWMAVEEEGLVEAIQPPVNPWDFFKQVSGIDDELSQTLWYIGYQSWDAIRRDVDDNGMKQLTRLPGIGSARAKAIYDMSLGG